MASNNNSVRVEAFKLVLWQFLIVMGLALILFLVQGIQSGISAFLGGLSYCIPNFMFVWRVFERTTARAAKQFLMAFVIGEASKLLLSAIFFVVIVKYLPVKVLPVLAGYIAAIVAFWMASFIFISHESRGQ